MFAGKKTSHNATVKYATTTKASGKFKCFGINDKNIRILEKMVANIVRGLPFWTIL
jgi:hypothetical protein